MLKSSIWNAESVASHRAVALELAARAEAGFAEGRYERYVWPYHSVGVLLMLAYLLFPPNTSRLYFYARYPLYAFAAFWSVRAILVCRSPAPPTGYGIGLINAYACVWLAAHLIWRDTRTQSFRLAWRDEGGESGGGRRRTTDNGSLENPQNGTVKVSGRKADGTAISRHRPSDEIEIVDGLNSLMDASHPHREYFWQPLPISLVERIHWMTTMILALRGEGTSHAPAMMPAPPTHVRKSLRRNSPDVPEPAWVSDSRTPVYIALTTRGTLAFFAVLGLVTYLVSDIAKNFMVVDPYFAGLAPITSPLPRVFHPFVGADLATQPAFTQAFRLLVAIVGILGLLNWLTVLVPLGLLGGLGARPEPWLWPSLFGTRYSIVATGAGGGGLAAWWGLWWHQMFRLAFSAPHAAICLLVGARPRGTPGRLLALGLAFAISAALHAAGSCTLVGPSRPWRGSGLFFLLQPVGIVLEVVVAELAGRLGLARRLPSWANKTLVMLWVHFWLYLTAPLLSDDVATAGAWLTEPVPVSVVSGLTGNGWLRWEGWMLPRWHSDPVWYKSGIAF